MAAMETSVREHRDGNTMYIDRPPPVLGTLDIRPHDGAAAHCAALVTFQGTPVGHPGARRVHKTRSGSRGQFFNPRSVRQSHHPVSSQSEPWFPQGYSANPLMCSSHSDVYVYGCEYDSDTMG